jgi:DNA modification methylase
MQAITKAHIDDLKHNNPDQLYQLIRDASANNDTLFLLESLGALPKNFDVSVLMPLLLHISAEVRFWAVKNIGKKSDASYLEALSEIARLDKNSMVRREAVSSIGRMRELAGVPTLVSFLDDPDPKVILQAIRGLLVFKKYPTVEHELRKLESHPNEIIQSVIHKAFAKDSEQTDKEPHPVSPAFMRNVVVHGDVREILACVPDESIHLTFTSPPYYNARDYSFYESYAAYLEFLQEVFYQVHRVTKEGRFLIVNTSPVIVPRVSRAHSSRRYPIPFDLHARLVANGWDFIDDIIWLKPESSVKNRNAGFLQHRKPLGYKPNATTEYLMVYRKHTDKLLDWNMRQYDWQTIEESRIDGNYETSNVWKIDPTFDKVHSAVFPLELCNRVITFYSYKGDLVFDPFAGSGTTGRAAQNLGRHFFMTEQADLYIDRIRKLVGQTLFDQNPSQFLDLKQFKAASERQPEHENY